MTKQLSTEELEFYARLSIDELDKFCTHTAVRASGPGGQSVNTADTKVLTRFNLDKSIRATSQRERSQYLNRRANLKKIHDKLVFLVTPEKERLDTKPTKASIARRLDDKSRKSSLKKSRRLQINEDE